MPAVVMDETVSCGNPLLFFAYQSGGFLADVNALFVSVWDLTVSPAVERVAEAAVDLTACESGGQKLGTGRYVPPDFTPNIAPDTWVAGTHEIRWRYQVAAGDPFKLYRQRFEVLTSVDFPTGASYIGYVDSSRLAANDLFSALAIDEIHRLIHAASRRVEDLTGRFFGPRFFTAQYNAITSPAFVLGLPIIGLDTISIIGVGPADILLPIDNDGLRVYNRHLVGLLDPDDRMNPRIEYASDLQPGAGFTQGTFVQGRQAVLVSAVFGYTEPDGSPVGRRPEALERAVGALAAKERLDPYGLDVSISSPYRIQSARTRDQAITFGKVGGEGSVTVGPLTGDRFVDDILIQYLRPPKYGAVGPDRVITSG